VGTPYSKNVGKNDRKTRLRRASGEPAAMPPDAS